MRATCSSPARRPVSAWVKSRIRFFSRRAMSCTSASTSSANKDSESSPGATSAMRSCPREALGKPQKINDQVHDLIGRPGQSGFGIAHEGQVTVPGAVHHIACASSSCRHERVVQDQRLTRRYKSVLVSVEYEEGRRGGSYVSQWVCGCACDLSVQDVPVPSFADIEYEIVA